MVPLAVLRLCVVGDAFVIFRAGTVPLAVQFEASDALGCFGACGAQAVFEPLEPMADFALSSFGTSGSRGRVAGFGQEMPLAILEPIMPLTLLEPVMPLAVLEPVMLNINLTIIWYCMIP
jgi:hypothetical protein